MRRIPILSALWNCRWLMFVRFSLMFRRGRSPPEVPLFGEVHISTEHIECPLIPGDSLAGMILVIVAITTPLSYPMFSTLKWLSNRVISTLWPWEHANAIMADCAIYAD